MFRLEKVSDRVVEGKRREKGVRGEVKKQISTTYLETLFRQVSQNRSVEQLLLSSAFPDVALLIVAEPHRITHKSSPTVNHVALS